MTIKWLCEQLKLIRCLLLKTHHFNSTTAASCSNWNKTERFVMKYLQYWDCRDIISCYTFKTFCGMYLNDQTLLVHAPTGLRCPSLGGIRVRLRRYIVHLEYFSLRNTVHVEKGYASPFWRASEVEVFIHSSICLPFTVQLEVRQIATSAGSPLVGRYVFNKPCAAIFSLGSSYLVWKMDLVWRRRS